MTVGDNAFSRGDLMRRVRLLEAEVRALRAARRLEAAAVGAGGLRVIDGGRVQIEDPAGDPALTLAPSGLTLSGLLSMLGGRLEWRNADDGALRFRIRATGGGDEATMSYRSGTPGGASEVVFGTTFFDGEVTGHGLIVSQANGTNILLVRSAAGGGFRAELSDRTGTAQVSTDDDGLARPLLAQHWTDGWGGNTVDSGDWTPVAEAWIRRSYPHMRMQYRLVRAGDVTVQVRLRDMVRDQTVGGPWSHGGSGRTVRDVMLPADTLTSTRHELQARISAGSGSARLAVTRCDVGDISGFAP